MPDYTDYIEPGTEHYLEQEIDDGTMPHNVGTLAETVIGHRIVKVEKGPKPEGSYRHWGGDSALKLTLDDGRVVNLINTDDCCAYTELEAVIEKLDTIDHVITGVRTEGGYTRWHLFADLGDVLEIQLDWSSGNPFYYGYGFEIIVEEPNEELA